MNPLNLFPRAINPLECLTGHGADSMFWPWALYWTAVVNGSLYIAVLKRWQTIVPPSRIQKALMLIFVFCAISGYWTLSGSYHWPGESYTVKLYTQCILIVLDCVFLWDTRKITFRIMAEEQQHHEAVERIRSHATMQQQLELKRTLVRQREEIESLLK